MKVRLHLIIIFVAFLVFGCSSNKKTTTNVKDGKSFHFVSGTGYAPFSSQNLPKGGLLHEVVKAAFQTKGYQVEIDLKPWKTAYETAKAQEYDGTVGWFYKKERAEVFLYSKPIVSDKDEPIYLLIAKDHPLAEKIINIFNQGLQEIEENGKLREFKRKYNL